MWEPSSSAGDFPDANHVAVPFVLLQTPPETIEIAFLTFENSEEVNPAEKQHAGEVVALVVEPP